MTKPNISNLQYEEEHNFMEYRGVLTLENLSYKGPFIIAKTIESIKDKDKFLESFLIDENQPKIAQSMYFLKYINRDNPVLGKNIESTAIQNHNEFNISEDSSLPYSLKRFNDDELDMIFNHVTWLQLTHGCGGDCVAGCGLDAVYRVRDRIPLEKTLYTLEEISKRKNRKNPPGLYFASDPLEIAENTIDFFKLTELYNKLFNEPLSISTSIPRGTEELYKEICNRNFPGISLRVSLTDHNVKRLYENKIINMNKLEDIPLFHGTNNKIPPRIFYDGLKPNFGVNIVNDNQRENLGINRYKIPGNKNNFCNVTALVMTPYGILNTIGITAINNKYPQGRIVVSVDRISDEEFNFPIGKSVDKYLQNCVVRFKGSQSGENRSFYVQNLKYHARVLVDKNAKIITSENNISDPGFERVRF